MDNLKKIKERIDQITLHSEIIKCELKRLSYINLEPGNFEIYDLVHDAWFYSELEAKKLNEIKEELKEVFNQVSEKCCKAPKEQSIDH